MIIKKNKVFSELANNSDENAYIKDITIDSIVDIVKQYFRKGKNRKEYEFIIMLLMKENKGLVKMVYMSVRREVLCRLPRLSERILNTPVKVLPYLMEITYIILMYNLLIK